jgi:hypothetical protein
MERTDHCAVGGVRQTRDLPARTGMKRRRFKGLEFGTHHSHKHVARFITSTVATSGIHVERSALPDPLTIREPSPSSHVQRLVRIFYAQPR